MVIKLLYKFLCVFVLFDLETNSKSGKIYLLATMKYTWCLLVATVHLHKSLQFVKKSYITLLPCLFMILLTVSKTTLCSTTFQPDLSSSFYIFSIFFYQLRDKRDTHKYKDVSISEIPRDEFFSSLHDTQKNLLTTAFRKLKIHQ